MGHLLCIYNFRDASLGHIRILLLQEFWESDFAIESATEVLSVEVFQYKTFPKTMYNQYKSVVIANVSNWGLPV